MRQRAKAINWIRLDQANDIAMYLATTYPAATKMPAEQKRLEQLTEEKCMRCHIKPTIFKTPLPLQAWIKINRRMQEKSPSFINDQQVQDISQYLTDKIPLE